ncbi:MAG: PfkB family carbohydrate kinase, partial [Thermodesulfobacteriota bacterium]
MSRVVVIGSANVDLTVRLERLPQLGETVPGGEFYTSFGGKGANQAVAAHRAGADVRFLAKVGCDQNGEDIIKHLEVLGLT